MSDLESDRSLWARALTGDGDAFAVVYDRYAPRLLTHAFRRTGSRQRAEDAVSLVMLETWRRRHEVRFGSDDSIAGWLLRTARFVLANDSRAATPVPGPAAAPKSDSARARVLSASRPSVSSR